MATTYEDLSLRTFRFLKRFLGDEERAKDFVRCTIADFAEYDISGKGRAFVQLLHMKQQVVIELFGQQYAPHSVTSDESITVEPFDGFF